ncbi:MAG TPA: MFS transporter [Vicinamibacterales bacterium]|nr:MFS transporter [Vicinamibacterales bacterium]
MTALLQRFFNIRREEVAPILVAAGYFFCVLTAIQVLRSARDAIGMRGGLDEVRWLFIGTAVVTLGVNPMFGWLVSRFRRLVFITATYAFFALSLVGFYALITVAPAAVGEVSGRVFYIWFSVFNLFSTMVFWALMADRFTPEQSKRLYGAIAVGGTLGAIFGPWLASVLVKPLGTAAMMLVSAGFLVAALGAARVVSWLQPGQSKGHATETAAVNRTVIGGNAWAGMGAVLRSRYLLGISAYVLLMSIMSTFLYFTRLSMVAALGDDIDLRATVFAQLDTITQVTTLLLQLVVTGHIMKRFGVSVALMLLPLTASLGFVGLAAAGSFAVLVLFQATFSAIQRAVARPARETLFTVVSREDKYKSKAVTDTFVYRGGDVIGAWTEGWLGSLGLALVGLASAVVPLAAAWALLGLWLGRRQGAMLSADGASAPEKGVPRPVASPAG